MPSTAARRFTISLALAGAVATTTALPALADTSHGAFLDRFSMIRDLAPTSPTAGPGKGDQNPYGVAVVSRTVGRLRRGDVLVSNFNNAANQQGTGSSIVEVSPSGTARVFAVVPPPTKAGVTGLTTALVALRGGLVIVGSLPAPGGNPQAATAGALTVLNPEGKVLETIRGGDIDGPWDMTAVQRGSDVTLFVTNVLNGTVAGDFGTVDRGTVVRLVLRTDGARRPKLVSERVIASGFAEHLDQNALVVGPTGLGLGRDGTLYVADSASSRIAAVPGALTRMHELRQAGRTVTQNGSLNDPLGLAIAPNGDILTVNGGDGNVVETSPEGQQVALKTLVPGGAGDLFGLALAPRGRGVYFVNDSGSGPAANSLELLH